MFILLTIIHTLVCLFLIGVVLLQSGKAADLAGAFGGMGSQTAFGPRGSATLLSKLTTGSAIVFMLTSMTLSIMATRGGHGPGSSVLDTQKAAQTPAAPAKAPVTTQTQIPVPQPVQPATAPGTTPAPGQPSVTLIDESTGAQKTLPLNIPPPPGQGQVPAGQQPQKAPAKK